MKSAWAVAGLGNTGDGLKMGLSLGADVLDTNYIKVPTVSNLRAQRARKATFTTTAALL